MEPSLFTFLCSDMKNLKWEIFYEIYECLTDVHFSKYKIEELIDRFWEL